MTPSVDDLLSPGTEREVMAGLTHLRKLLRVRNQLRSPLLQLPTETIVRILSFIMAGLDSYFHADVWWSIYGTCHRIHGIMCSATELWWKVHCARARAAHFILTRSRGNPRVIVSDLRSVCDGRIVAAEKILSHWRDKRGFKGHRLHTLEYFGPPSSFDHFSWILERPLPRVRDMKIHVTDSTSEEEIPLPHPFTLELPVDIPLQLLDLRNVVLSWSSQLNLFNGLRELHLNFRDCDPAVIIPEDQLFGILSASQKLECLSLVRVGHEVPVRNGEPLSPKRILQFPNLTSLTLDNDPMVIKYTLAYMDLPAITSLAIRSFISWDVVQTFKNRLFPDDRLLTRLSPNPPTFAVRTAMEDSDTSIEADIGGIKLRFDFPLGQGERGRSVVMSCIPPLVPRSVTALELEYTQLTEREWREFFTSHPEVRSIECTEFFPLALSKSLWDALSPAGEDNGVPCPRLESVLITSFTKDMVVVFTPLSDCLRKRQTAGFKLRRLRMVDYHQLVTDMDGFYEEFDPLVEVLEARKPGRFVQRVSPVSVRGLRTY
jgi:hypothetical protein